VAGRFAMDDRDGLLLTTGYETMNSLERFSFAGPNVRLRTSTVEGLSNTASFCIETRLADTGAGEGVEEQSREEATDASVVPAALSALGW
jgi:hypothetical protein